MSEDEPRDSAEDGKGESTGYASLSMNVVAASRQEQPAEQVSRGSRPWLLLVLVVGVAGLIAWGTSVARNAHPGEAAEQLLQERVRAMPAFTSGLILRVRYLAGNRARLDFSPRAGAADEEGRRSLREATKAVMEIMIEERPGRDLYLDAYQSDMQIAEAQYRSKSTLVSPDRTAQADIVVMFAGEEEGGVNEMLSPGRRVVGDK